MFPGTDAYVKLLDIGPPVGRPVQYRVSGPGLQTVRDLAQKVAGLMAGNANLGEPIFDWNEPARVIKIDVLQDKARQLGVSSVDIASALDNVVSGGTVTQLRDDIYLIDVIARAKESERGSIETLQTLQLPATNGQSVPLAAVAKFGYGLEQPKIWRRSRLPTITVQGAVRGAIQPATVVQQLEPAMAAFRAALPAGYQIVTGGAVEESAKGARADRRGGAADAVHHGDDPDAAIAELSAAVPGFRRRPAGADRRRRRVAAEPRAAGLRRDPGGAGADRHPHPQLGDSDHPDRTAPRRGTAAVGRGGGRDRASYAADPLTAAAATLALIPIAREIFWGPMAYAMMGGIVVGTVLTLLFLPALYVAWFRIEPAPQPRGRATIPAPEGPLAAKPHSAE